MPPNHSSDDTIKTSLKPIPIPIPIPSLMTSIVFAITLVALLSFYFTAAFPCPTCISERRRSIQESFNAEQSQTKPVRVPTSTAHVMFGIAASADTWGHRRHYCELWWRRNATRGFVWMDRHLRRRWPRTSPPYLISASIDRFHYTSWGSRAAVRIARVVKENFALAPRGVRWFVMGDDDTVFFPENLVTMLRKYDHREMHYLGSISESVEQDVVHSYGMGYGGGGFAISYPLAAQLVRILDGCINRYAHLYGSDQKIGACVAEIGVSLRREHGFHQMDIRGSPYGILSAHPVAPLLSLHHLDFVQPLFPGMSRVGSIRKLFYAYLHDNARVLQHTICYDTARNWSVSLSWGYSIQVYPFLLNGKDLSTPLQTFLTWRTWSQQPFTFDTRPLSLEPCERPVLFYLDGIEQRGPGRTITRYARSRAVRWKLCNRKSYSPAYLIKGIYVSAPLLHPDYYNKASPRRQCCDIVRDSNMRNGVMQMRVRYCRRGESANVPL